MSRRHASFRLLVLASVLTVGCGGGSSPIPVAPKPGTVFIFGTDAPACGVESFPVTITSASLVAQGGGQITTVVSPAAPATVDFARLEGFTNLMGNASVPPGKYSDLNVSLANPGLVTLNTANSPPSPQVTTVTLTSTSFLVPINPPLVVTSTTNSGLTFDFNLRQSVQLNASGQPTGTVDPQITLSPNTSSASSVGEATALYGVAGAPGAAGVSGSYTGSFPLTLNDGTGQTISVLVDGNTVFEGDGVTSLSQVAANDFVEVDAVVNDQRSGGGPNRGCGRAHLVGKPAIGVAGKGHQRDAQLLWQCAGIHVPGSGCHSCHSRAPRRKWHFRIRRHGADGHLDHQHPILPQRGPMEPAGLHVWPADTGSS